MAHLTVNSRYSGHPRNHDLVFIIARDNNNGVRENFYFKPYLEKEVTYLFIFFNSTAFLIIITVFGAPRYASALLQY